MLFTVSVIFLVVGGRVGSFVTIEIDTDHIGSVIYTFERARRRGYATFLWIAGTCHAP